MKHAVAKTLKIGVIPMGDVPALAAKVIVAHVEMFYSLRADVLAGWPSPGYALDANRMQYDAGLVLDALEKEKIGDYEKIIGVVGGDLFVPIFTYVLGEARQAGRCALISLFRLAPAVSPGQVPSSQLLERCAKVALHELGHLFNLIHCSDPLCLMHISADVQQLDQRHLNLCRYCRRFLEQTPTLHKKDGENL